MGFKDTCAHLAAPIADRLIPSRRHARAAESSIRRMEAFMRALPFEYCGWNRDGVQAISNMFPALLNVKTINTIDDILQALDTPDAAALAGLYERLRENADPFDVTVTIPGGMRILRLMGKRGRQEIGNDDDFYVIWAQDVTTMAKRLRDMQSSLDNAETRQAAFKSTLNALPFAIWVRDEQLDISWCNRTYARLMDTSQATVIADQKELHGTGKNKDWNVRALAQKALAGRARETERQHLIVEGNRRLMEISEIPATGDGLGIGCAVDVTREEDLMGELTRLAGAHKDVLEQLRTAIAIFDGNTRLEFYNSAYEQLWGLDGKFLNGSPRLVDILDRLRETRRLPEQADFRAWRASFVAKFTSLMQPQEDMMHLPDGTALRAVTIPRPQGGLILTFEDVTARLKLESSYNILVAVQKETIDSLSDGLVVFGEDGRLRLANPALALIFGLDAAILETNPHINALFEGARDLFRGDDWDKAREALLRNGLSRDIQRGQLTFANGSVIAYSAVPLPDGNVLNTYKDITSEINVEKALMERNAALEEAEQLKTDFLANVSYQLRTPLNVLVGFAEILNQQYFGKMNDKQLEYTYGMIEAGQRLINLVDDILDLSTIEAGYMHLEPAPVSVRDLLHGVLTVTEEWARREGVKIAVTCPRSVGSIVADERRLKQALLNLVSNAITFSEGKGTITLFAHAPYGETGDVEIGVADQGVGIPLEDLKRVLSPFERAHNVKASPNHTGAGLGLSLVKSIVELHGGHVTIESSDGQTADQPRGTRVTCTLPRKAKS